MLRMLAVIAAVIVALVVAILVYGNSTACRLPADIRTGERLLDCPPPPR